MSSKIIKYLLVFLMSILILAPEALQAEGNKKDGGNKLNKTDVQTTSTYFNINNISSFFYNNGISDIASSGNSGFVYPKGSGKTAVFTSGLLWGAKVAGFTDPRVGGTAYRTGLVPGKVLANGTADDATLDKYRIFRVRRDIYPGGPTVDLTNDSKDEGISSTVLRTAYETDWTQWPADMGAPFDDKNGDGVYQADKDIPGIPGADQTLWFVTNDLTSSKTILLYNSNPLGIECQVTIWGYNQAGALGNTYFRKYKLINTTNRTASPITFDDMYVSMWSDVDLGDAGDDFVGVDTVLSLQYCYNAAANDNTYRPLPPPAVGFDFFQGPLLNGIAGQDLNKNGIDDASDYGIFNNAKVGPGKINLPMTAAYYFANGDLTIGDPPQGTNAPADGYRQFYNFFQGKFGISGAPFINLATGEQTTYALSGDPVKRTGWLDGAQLPAGDRRQGSASGPFTMAPGDTQEVVVAEIVAGAIPGVDRLSAIELLKFYDQQAQVAYDNFFNLPVAPPAPIVTVTPLDKEIVLDWSKDEAKYLATEKSDSKGYKFQGYNIYQLPTAFSAVTEGFRVATFDAVDGIGKINDLVFDPTTGSVVTLPVQFGNDNGIKRFISITNDLVRGGVPLVNGIKYYYAITAYSYNSSLTAVPNNLENPISILTIVPQVPDPGVTLGDAANESLELKHTGAADGSPAVSVVDPAATLGHDYEVFFTDRQEIRDLHGDWIAGSKVSRRFSVNHPDTLTGTSIDAAAVYGPSGAPETELHFLLNLTSADDDYADAITITFPVGTSIVSAPTFTAGNGDIATIIKGNTVIFGDTSHPYTGNGPFAGGEEFKVIVSSLTLPATINWVVFDDGYGGGPIDAFGTSTISTIGTSKRTALYWNLKDATSGVVKLENQGTVVDKNDATGFTTLNFYPKRDDIPVYSTITANPVVDGFQIGVNGGYDAPINFNKKKLTLLPKDSPTTLSSSSKTTNLDIQNYTIFGGTVTSKAIDNFGFGTDVLAELQQDYELKFTGVWETTVVGTDTIIKIKDGTGSLATIFSTSSGAAGLATHPLNPTPGVAAPFLIRIPFEVWNKDTKKQVNLMFRDRAQTAASNPFYAWNPKNRMYAVIVNSDYNETTPLTGALRNPATWVLVFYGTNYNVGDVVTVSYDNPFVIGLDKYAFSTKGSSFSKSLAENQVDKINVFPNPYYGVNSEELNKYNRFVTFSHLPAKATIRIFNLAGVNVKTIEKVSTGQFQRWDLANEAGLPVASGLYIVYIDLPELGKTTVLKVAVIQEKQILDRF
ncbi:MAG: T9SS type A sorting domain-containing protein [Ignavibacteriaceae bacterium]|nr:T9SS type A sorting domain-containing protein [Ignavibacteriaceae bacterium]